MSIIKDIVDLTTQLSKSVKDRKFASEIFHIQSLISTLQSEHTSIIEKNTNLLTENADIKIQNSKLKQEIFDLNEKHKRPPKKGRMIHPGINLDDI